jgi:ribosomal protein S18 acetylase RimI-like enzyme
MDIQTFNDANLNEAWILFQEMVSELGTGRHMRVDKEGFRAGFLKPQLSSLTGLIGYLEDEPIALASYSYDFSIYNGRPVLSFKEFYVRPRHRRGGYGQQLLLQVIREAKYHDCVHIRWHVHADNKIAQAYYGSLGFTPSEDVLDYRATPEDMLKRVKKS